MEEYWREKDKLLRWELEGRYKCVICGAYAASTVRKLCGGYMAKLCDKHINAWHEHIMGKPIWKQYLSCLATHEHYKKIDDLEGILNSGKDTDVILQSLFILSKKWVEENKAKED